MYSRGGGGGFGRYRNLSQQDVAEKRNPFTGLSRMLPWVRPYWVPILVGVISMVICTYLGAQPPRLVGYTADIIIGKQHYRELTHYVLLMLEVFVGIAVFGFLRTYWLHVAGQRLLHACALSSTRISSSCRSPITTAGRPGDLMSRMTGDVEQVEQMVEHGLDVFLMGLFGMVLIFYLHLADEPRCSRCCMLHSGAGHRGEHPISSARRSRGVPRDPRPGGRFQCEIAG